MLSAACFGNIEPVFLIPATNWQAILPLGMDTFHSSQTNIRQEQRRPETSRECSPKKTQTHRAFQCFSDTICWQNLKWLWYDDGVLFAKIHFMLVLPPAFPSSTLLDYMNDGKILAKIFLQVGTFPEIYFWHQLLKDKFSRRRNCLSNEPGYFDKSTFLTTKYRRQQWWL